MGLLGPAGVGARVGSVSALFPDGDAAAPVGAPLALWQVRDGLPVPQFSHPDRTALCPTAAGRPAGWPSRSR